MIYCKINYFLGSQHKDQIIKILSINTNIVIGAIFGLVFGALIGQAFNYIIVGVASGASIGIVVGSAIKRDDPSNRKNQMSSKAAEAMASKIIFEAEQHRKNRDRYNYMKINRNEEGQIYLNIHRGFW